MHYAEEDVTERRDLARDGLSALARELANGDVPSELSDLLETVVACSAADLSFLEIAT